MGAPMHYTSDSVHEEFRPRLILWQLTHPHAENGNGNSREFKLLSSNERHLILEGIARTAKPIVVLTGEDLPPRDDIYELVQYGIALGLKMIVEARPGDLTMKTLKRYSSFGPRIFRIIIDQAVRPGVDTRFLETAEFRKLEETIAVMKDAGSEVHLSMVITSPDVHQLAVSHDYAFRKSAQGFYCHLAINTAPIPSDSGEIVDDEIDRYIDAVANIKQYCPSNMYYMSPQCVKYGYRHIGEELNAPFDDEKDGETREWKHWCLGGKSFAYITADGMVQVCSQLPIENGDLRQCGYDFKEVWESSQTFQRLRECVHTCTQTREALNYPIDISRFGAKG